MIFDGHEHGQHLEYIKHLVTQKVEREMAFPRHCQGHRKAILKGEGSIQKCAATASSELPVIYWEKKPGEEGSLERRCSNSQVREALVSKARSTWSSSGVMSALVTHRALPFSAAARCQRLALATVRYRSPASSSG